MDDAGAHKGSPITWSEYEAQGGGEADLSSLPDAVRAIVEECRVQSKTADAAAAAAAKEEAPYPCRMYEEAAPGDDDMLQLQWMRVDMSTMDSERCWGEDSHRDEHDCGPNSGVVLPAVYSLDPAQLLSSTLIGLPPELQRARQGSSLAFHQRDPEELPEDHLFQLGKSLTEALSSERGSQEGLPPDVVGDVAMLSGADWSVCLERYVDLPRCDPVVLAQVLSTTAPPTLDCLLGAVLPAVVARISSNSSSGSSDSRDTAAVHAICRLAASVAVAGSSTTLREGEGNGAPDPVQFRDKISGSELRKLGPLGREAEVALAEEFFYREAEGAT